MKAELSVVALGLSLLIIGMIVDLIMLRRKLNEANSTEKNINFKEQESSKVENKAAKSIQKEEDA
jgi:hypothetical protein